MIKELSEYIRKQKLFHTDQRVLLTVSGGVDSMVMVELFHQSELNFGIAHCNFQLRGVESDQDEAFVKEFAVRNGISFHGRRFDTSEYAKKHQISIQMAARELRKAWFFQLRQQMHYDYIATAHHLNDSLETTIFNLTKGSGIAGLRGILPKDGVIIRPMMFASRGMIARYAKTHKVPWREDSSNQSTKYRRNLIRHKVIPELRKINPGLEKTFVRTASRLRATEYIFNKEVQALRETIFQSDGQGYKISKNALKSMKHGTVLLAELLQEYGFVYAQAADIITSLSGSSGKSFYTATHKLIIDREYMLLQKKDNEKQQPIQIFSDTGILSLPHRRLVLEHIQGEIPKFSSDPNIAQLDDALLKYPLELRVWKEGERFQPLGMNHKKKLSDFMIDEKIPLNLKGQQLVLISEGEVVWVVGQRIDDRYKITSNTTNILKICNQNINDQSI